MHQINHFFFFGGQIGCVKAHQGGLPVIMLYGTEDKTVDYLLNGKLLEEAYCNNQVLLTIIPRNSQGHHPHGLLHKSDELAELVISKLNF